MKYLKIILVACLLVSVQVSAQQRKLVVQADRPTTDISPYMWGLFFEDINFAADGGIYGELVKNRSFEFQHPLTGWRTINEDNREAKLLAHNLDPDNGVYRPRYIRLESPKSDALFGSSNEGFRGMGVRKDIRYNVAIKAKKVEGDVELLIQLEDRNKVIIGSSSIKGFTGEWQNLTTSFTCTATDSMARLNVWMKGKGKLDIDMVSMFPEDTWNNRPNGMRTDMTQLLADMKPGLLRFPGGCIVEGYTLSLRYQWKNTVGPIDQRNTLINRWSSEIRRHPAPDYYQSFGLGFFEYFQLAEDLGATPLPILSCGMACQFNSGEVVEMDELDPYIQDALDLIEFANGAVTTKWGKLRADMGHPAPFNMQFIGIGNEQWGPQYIERYKVFESTLRESHPEIKIISTSGPYASGEWFDYLWGELRNLSPDLVDEHYYMPPQSFLRSAKRYDNYPRTGPKIFAGEYAAHSRDEKEAPESRNNWESALYEAAFMTGLERNADIVRMTSYAPLFGNVSAWQWRPDLIWFDNLRVVGSANYHVQKLYSVNKGTHYVPIMEADSVVAGHEGLFASTVIDKNTNELILKIININPDPGNVQIDIKGVRLQKGNASVVTMQSNDLTAYNSLDAPDVIVPKEESLQVKNNTLNLTLPARSFSIYKFRYAK